MQECEEKKSDIKPKMGSGNCNIQLYLRHYHGTYRMCVGIIQNILRTVSPERHEALHVFFIVKISVYVQFRSADRKRLQKEQENRPVSVQACQIVLQP